MNKSYQHLFLLLFALVPAISFSQQSKLSFEASYFQLFNESYTQGQYEPIVDVGFRVLLRENKTHNFGFSLNGNFSKSSFNNNRYFNTLQLRLISSLFPMDSSRLHPFYGVTFNRFSNNSVRDHNITGGSFNNSTINISVNNWAVGPTVGLDFFFGKRKIGYIKFQYDLLFRYEESTYLKVSNLLKVGLGARIGNSYRD